MRRILLTSFFSLALLVSVGAPEASAQTSYDAFGNAYSTPAEASAADTKALSAAATAGTAQSAGKNQPITPKPSSDEAYGTVMQKIMELFAWLVGVAALTLDTAVFYTVVRMGDYVNNLSAIGVAWQILRDVGNIMLIFGFLAIGITTILNVDWYGGGKKMLPMLFIGAIFLNFSLFITEAVIDTGNLFATQFYKQINGGNMPTAANTASATVKNEGISNKLMSQLGMQTIYNVNDGRVRSDVFNGSNTWLIGFMGILLFIVTAFVLFSLAFVLIARFVILIFLIILAPVGFAGLAIPQLKGKAKQWWDTLFEQTITAPVLLLMLYVALAVITDAQFLIGFNSTGATWLGYINNNDLPGFGGVILSFLVAMGLLLFVVVASKKLSAFGADWASQTAGKLTFGATALAGRTTVGWGANRLAKYTRGTALGRVPLVGTGVVRGLENVAARSFDVRGAATAGGLKAMSIDAGAAQKGGYKADLKARIESRTKYAGELSGKDLTEDEKIDQKVLQDNIKATEKRLAEAQVRQRNAAAAGRNTQDIDDEIVAAKSLLSGHKTKLETLESKTAKGAQRKYASNLELGYLKKVGVSDEALKFLNAINPAANTDAAKKIREEAKKSSDDKTLDQLKKALKKAGGEDEHAAPAAAPAAPVGGAPAGGGGH